MNSNHAASKCFAFISGKLYFDVEIILLIIKTVIFISAGVKDERFI